MFAYQRWPGRGLTFFYGFIEPRHGDRNGDRHDDRWREAAREAVRALVERLGGVVRDAPVSTRWRYFPHVTPRDMADGFYPRLEALQGRRRTYWCGEILAFATMETVVDYARELAARMDHDLRRDRTKR